MEFYLHNKDDRKLKTLVNLVTTFKIDDDNYIIYYNTEVEKTVIDIYIGKISYGDECLVINKLPSDKQNKFLEVIKQILANKNPEIEFSDYKNIIDTATIVLESVQKIQIPTSSLDLLKNYHTEEINVENNEEFNGNEINIEQKIENENSDNEIEDNETISFEIDNNFNDDNINSQSNENNEQKIENTSESKIEENDSNNFINSNDMLNGLDNLLNEREEKKKIKSNKEKKINTPLLIILILVLMVTVILYFIGNGI